MSYELDRVRSTCQAMGVIVVAALVANAAMTLTTAAFPGWLPHQFFGIDFVTDNRQRALAAAAQVRSGDLDDRQLTVILGLSSASEGIALRSLTGGGAEPDRTLALVGAGRNMEEVARYAEPLLASDIGIRRVVFAISTFHLVDPPPLTEGFVANLRQAQTRAELAGRWFSSRRGDVKHAFDSAIVNVRSGLFQGLHVRLGEHGPSPWRDTVRMGLIQLTTDSEWSTVVHQYGLRGYYDPLAYTRSRRQAASLVDLIRRFRSQGAEVTIVLMPEHSELRRRIPPEATAALVEPLTHGLAAGPPPIVDLRDAIADDGFTDISHLNETGRRRFSPILAAALAAAR